MTKFTAALGHSTRSAQLDLFPRRPAPRCCLQCRHFIIDTEGYEQGWAVARYCNLSLMLPFHKQSCARQRPKGASR